MWTYKNLVLLVLYFYMNMVSNGRSEYSKISTLTCWERGSRDTHLVSNFQGRLQ